MPILLDLPFPQQVICVFLSAAVAETCSHPLEVAKINSQTLAQAGSLTEAKAQEIKLWSLLKRSIAEMNPKHLYRGLTAAIIGSSKARFINFNTYDILINKVFTSGVKDEEAVPLTTKLMASVLSAFATFWVFNPWDIIRVRMAADIKGEYPSLRSALYKTFKTDGLLELYKGSSLNFGFIVLATATDLTIYQHTKEYLEKRYRSKGKKFDPRIPLISSILASIATAIVTFPVDYLKNVYVNEHSKGEHEMKTMKHLLNMVADVYRRNGLKGYTKGFGLYLISYMLYTPILWTTFETIKHSLKRVSPSRVEY